jgi:hypothetical protein
LQLKKQEWFCQFTTTANEHDSIVLKTIVEKTERRKMKKGIFADKGFKLLDNDNLLIKGTIKKQSTA